MTPPSNHKASMSKGLRRSPINNPEVVKIPAPIMFAITMLVAENSPTLRTSDGFGFNGVD
jgi:hypothetical protein